MSWECSAKMHSCQLVVRSGASCGSTFHDWSPFNDYQWKRQLTRPKATWFPLPVGLESKWHHWRNLLPEWSFNYQPGWQIVTISIHYCSVFSIVGKSTDYNCLNCILLPKLNQRNLRFSSSYKVLIDLQGLLGWIFRGTYGRLCPAWHYDSLISAGPKATSSLLVLNFSAARSTTAARRRSPAAVQHHGHRR